MIELIVGGQGKGKTGKMLDKVNSEIKEASGNIVYLDKNTKHMYELNNKIRLVDVSEYGFTSCDEFYGFICGIISQDHDLEKIYLDSFLKIACINADDIERVIEKLDMVSSKFKVDIIISLSANADTLSEAVKQKVIVAL